MDWVKLSCQKNQLRRDQVNLSSMSLLGNLRGNNSKQFGVIGLGRFGQAVSATLHTSGYEVLAADSSDKIVEQCSNQNMATEVINIDSTESSALKEAGFLELDTVIVAIGSYLAESITTVLNLKEGGVKRVIAKASSETHKKLLEKVGADRVVFPEREMGLELARSITKPRILDQLELDAEHSIVEVMIPPKFANKTLVELDLRNRYHLTVLAVSQNQKLEINPPANKLLREGERIVVLGSNKNIDSLPN